MDALTHRLVPLLDGSLHVRDKALDRELPEKEAEHPDVGLVHRCAVLWRRRRFPVPGADDVAILRGTMVGSRLPVCCNLLAELRVLGRGRGRGWRGGAV